MSNIAQIAAQEKVFTEVNLYCSLLAITPYTREEVEEYAPKSDMAARGMALLPMVKRLYPDVVSGVAIKIAEVVAHASILNSREYSKKAAWEALLESAMGSSLNTDKSLRKLIPSLESFIGAVKLLGDPLETRADAKFHLERHLKEILPMPMHGHCEDLAHRLFILISDRSGARVIRFKHIFEVLTIEKEYDVHTLVFLSSVIPDIKELVLYTRNRCGDSVI